MTTFVDLGALPVHTGAECPQHCPHCQTACLGGPSGYVVAHVCRWLHLWGFWTRPHLGKSDAEAR